MTLPYGFAKAIVAGAPRLTAKRMRRETQYHVHVPLDVGGAAWDVAVNVGTDDADDLLTYKLVFDYHHPLVEQLAAAAPGRTDLTGQARLPALDFLRSDVLDETGAWRRSDPMDGSLHPEPVASIMRLLAKAREAGSDVYVVKSSSLGAAIAYPELFQIFGGTVLNQSGREIETMAVLAGIFLSISLTVSTLMNWYNRRVAPVTR